MKKTSLLIDEGLYRLAEKEALKKNSSVGNVISEWAKLGRKYTKRTKESPQKFIPLNLGSPALISLDSRSDWMDLLDER